MNFFKILNQISRSPWVIFFLFLGQYLINWSSCECRLKIPSRSKIENVISKVNCTVVLSPCSHASILEAQFYCTALKPFQCWVLVGRLLMMLGDVVVGEIPKSLLEVNWDPMCCIFAGAQINTWAIVCISWLKFSSSIRHNNHIL